MNSASHSLSLVIPAFNEAANIERCVTLADRSCKRLVDNYEIIVVDDGSSDATHLEARKIADQFPHVRLLRKANGGIGSAVTFGFDHANGELLTYAPADCQFDFEELDELIRAVKDHDMVVGEKGDYQVYSVGRRAASTVYRLLLRLFFGIRFHDVNFIHLYRAAVYRQIRPRAKGGFFHAETIARAVRAKLRIAKIGLRLQERHAGRSTIWSVGKIVQTLFEMVYLRLTL